MVDVVLNDVSYRFPHESVQGAYIALKVLGIKFDEKCLKLKMVKKFGIQLSEKKIIGASTCIPSVYIIFNDYVIESYSRDAAVNWLRGYYGVFNVLRQKANPTLLIKLKIVNLSEAIEKFLPPITPQTIPIICSDVGPKLPHEVIKLIGEKCNFMLQQKIQMTCRDQNTSSIKRDKYFGYIKYDDMNNLLLEAAGHDDIDVAEFALANGAELYEIAAQVALARSYHSFYRRILRVLDLDYQITKDKSFYKLVMGIAKEHGWQHIRWIFGHTHPKRLNEFIVYFESQCKENPRLVNAIRRLATGLL